MATSSQRPRRQNVHENILKQGYLKKCMGTSNLIPSAAIQLATSIKQKLEPNRWYVFGVRNTIPFLEYYEKEESIFTGKALETFDLSTYENLSYTMGRTNTNFSFCIYMSEYTIELMAPNRAQMVDWCNCLQRHLHNLGLRTRNAKSDHTYSEFPVKPKPPTRSPQPDDYLFDTQDAEEDSEEQQEPVYDDPHEFKLNDRNNNNASPELPPRHRQQSEEDVFASLGSVTRISAEREIDYTNIRDTHENPDFAPEEIVFAGARNGNSFESDDDSDESRTVCNGAVSDPLDADYLHTNALRKHNSDPAPRGIDNDVSDKTSSLPVNIHKKSETSDTSEDSDFISTSFWLRHKKADFFAQGKATDCKNKNLPPIPTTTPEQTPPPLPKRDATLEKRVKKMKVSRDHDFSDLSSDSSSSDDDGNDHHKDKHNDNFDNIDHDDDNDIRLLGVAPSPPVPASHNTWMVDSKYTDTGTFPVFSSDKLTSKEKPIMYQVKPFTEERPVKHSRSEKFTDLTACADDDIKLPARKMHEESDTIKMNHYVLEEDTKDGSDDGGGTYETLVKADEVNDPITPCKVQDKEYEEEIYEAAWQAKSKIFEEPKKLHVTLPDEEDYVQPSEPKKCASKPGPNMPQKREQALHSVKSRVSKLFSRKSEERELPDTLSVNTCEASDENLYSDMPDGTAAVCPETDSDILRLSREKNPVTKPTTSPVLPKRAFSVRESKINSQAKDQLHLKSSTYAKGAGMSQSVTDDLDMNESESYEPMSRSVGPELGLSGPPIRILRNKQSEVAASDPSVPPVAPPRRNRKTICVSSDQNGKYSMDLGGNKLNDFSDMPRLPQRQPSYKEHSEPMVPPRDYVKFEAEKRPPPPRPRVPPTRQGSLDSAPTAAPARPKAFPTVITNLKQNQADTLKSEIETTGGMTVIIQKSHFQNGIAFVECFEKIWIAGWDLRRFPRLFDKFHIGDQLISINDVHCSDLSFAHKLIKNVKAESIEVTVRRLPYGKVFAIQRSAEGESLGIKREGGTAEIVYVDPLGLAYNYGLTTKAANIDGTGHSNWFLTEINMRPLNLFFKDQEIEHRLMAVGRDISIVVQPHYFIKEIKRQLKKLRGYKDYLVQ